MTITEQADGDNYIVSISGHIDTATANDVQQAILLSFQKSVHIILDLTAVEYISSSGLRAVLIGQKTASSKHGSFLIRGASPELHKLFALVGFEKILHFE